MTTLERIETVSVSAAPIEESLRLERAVVAIEFPDVFRAHEAMLAAARLERRLSIVLNDAAVVTRDIRGRVSVNRGGRPTPLAAGLWAAAAIGLPMVWLLGPWAGLAGAVVAAVAAALWSRKAVGLRPRFLRRIGGRLVPGTGRRVLPRIPRPPGARPGRGAPVRGATGPQHGPRQHPPRPR